MRVGLNRGRVGRQSTSGRIPSVLLSRLGRDTLPDAVRRVSEEAFSRPLDVIVLR
ncbi:hypothetical protein GCM10007079_32300 [Nocardiopsis terrae]|nr:hypothetical protein GCM10007079_32300 [Nocardiopsis terrae]